MEAEKVDMNKKKGRGTGPKKGSGGRRVGSGRKKGSKNVKTILKEEAAKELAEKNLLKKQIIEALPANLQRSSKALKEAIAEINEEEVEELFKKRIALHSSSLLTSMLSAAMGQQFLFKVVTSLNAKNQTIKRHVQVTDPKEIQQYLDNPLEVEGDDYFYITDKQPDINAINSLLDRFMGRPTTKLIGPKGPDGEEGPVKVIVANFGTQQPPVEQAADAGHIAGEIVQDVITTENGDSSTT